MRSMFSSSGKVTEEKAGHFYLTTTEWEDGHVELEIHYCRPELVLHSCDKKQVNEARAELLRLAEADASYAHPPRLLVQS